MGSESSVLSSNPLMGSTHMGFRPDSQLYSTVAGLIIFSNRIYFSPQELTEGIYPCAYDDVDNSVNCQAWNDNMTNFSHSPHLGKIQDAGKSSVNAIEALSQSGRKDLLASICQLCVRFGVRVVLGCWDDTKAKDRPGL